METFLMKKYKFRVFDINADSYMKPELSGRVPVWTSDKGGITLDLALQGKDLLFKTEIQVFGKQDSNGKPIYENDIIKVVDPSSIHPDEFFIVRWIKTSYGPALGMVSFTGVAAYWPSRYYETYVIGNTNENQDLLGNHGKEEEKSQD